MSSDPPPLDLLVVGGLTVDRFADGSSAPGGTVIHVARAAGRRGLRIGVVTASGEEPEAVAGLAELRHLASPVESTRHEHTTAFGHREGPSGRRLWLDHLGGSVELEAASAGILARAILYAPVADEIPLDALGFGAELRRRGAILQGWLRSTDEGVEVRPLPLSAMSPQLVEALAGFDLLVASREDLSAESDAPHDQLTALRRVLGRAPELIVTDGAEGLWLPMRLGGPHGSLRRHFAVPWRVETDATIGAGDILAAFLTAGLGRGPTEAWIEDAMSVVAEVLEERTLRSGEA